MKSTHHHLPDQLSQGTVEQKMVNTSMLAAEVAMGITSPTSPEKSLVRMLLFSINQRILTFIRILVFHRNFYGKLPSTLSCKYKSLTLNWPEEPIFHFTLSFSSVN
jgi:hypothetical protein